MSSLLEENKRYQKCAKEFLASSNLVKILGKYGEVRFTGAYPLGLMMHGDVDIYVVRNDPFIAEEVFEIFRELYFSTDFRSYFMGGDWDDPRKGNEFPRGRYVGMKRNINKERWKFDLWFIGKEELKRLQSTQANLSNLTPEQKGTILRFKKIRKEEKLNISAHQIYELVLNRWIETAEDFRRAVTKE